MNLTYHEQGIIDTRAERDQLVRQVAKLKARLLSVGCVVAAGSPEDLAQRYAVLHDALCVLSIGHAETCTCRACVALSAVEEPPC